MAQLKKDNRAEYFLTHNNEEIENIKVISYLLHKDVYKSLRHFKIPQYDHIYVMRKKKGFNTLFFQQNYDVVITDHDGIVLDALTDIPTGYVSSHYPKGHFIYFMTVGSINHYSIQKKNRLRINSKKASRWM